MSCSRTNAAFSRQVNPASPVTIANLPPNCSQTRGNTVRNAGDSPSLAPMNSMSKQGLTIDEVNTARREPSVHRAPPAPHDDSLAPSTSWLVLDQLPLPSKLTTPSEHKSFCTTLRLSNSRTCAQSVSRKPSGFCFAAIRYRVLSETFLGSPRERRAPGPRSSPRSSARRSVTKPTAKDAISSPSIPR